MIPKRALHGTLKSLAPHFGITPDNLSAILNGHRGISKERSIEFSNICEKLGYKVTETDWMFYPEKVKEVFNHKAINNDCELHSLNNERV